jgi:hypothetical protein
MTAVVNVRDHRPWGEFPPFVYVGRSCAGLKSHPLANPFKVAGDATDAERRECLARYAAWLHTLPDLDSRLRMLRGKTGGRLPLGCWCVAWTPGGPELLCHAVTLARMIDALPEGTPCPTNA